jgi:hypothetical protein
MGNTLSLEEQRLAESNRIAWRKWGPYLSARAWGTVREDYSESGDAWGYFSHDAARSRVFRWGDDGLGGFCDDHQNLCLAVALWNEQDPILKERLFGLTNAEGNHGEDVKEIYHSLDGTPTHTYMKMSYCYPQVAYPYAQLVDGNRNRSGAELELQDVLQAELAAGKYFDVTIEYAKADAEDIVCRIRATNRAQAAAPLHLLPHLWYRNTWSWDVPAPAVPQLRKTGAGAVATDPANPYVGQRTWYVQDSGGGTPALLFTDNESHRMRLGWPEQPGTKYFKDGVHLNVVPAERDRFKQQSGKDSQSADWINPANQGSKVAAHFSKTLAPGETWEVQVRLSPTPLPAPFANFGAIFATRIQEADAFYGQIQTAITDPQLRLIQRQALAGLLWNKQFYYFDVERWLHGDTSAPPPPAQRLGGRDSTWRQLDAMNVILVPDSWEYPWFAAWDLAFHCVATAIVDPAFAKQQVLLLMREYYMKPNGQLPAYEWEFSDLNPPVTAWAALEIYRREQRISGKGDTDFLARVFHKALLNFTWWVNRVDQEGDNLFQGGFLGLDNISVIDRSALGGGHIDQADGTAWMAVFCSTMLSMAIELALVDPSYEEMAVKFLDHFMYIAQALVHPQEIDPTLEPLWDDHDRFFYDHLYPLGSSQDIPLRIRSFVGLVPLLAADTLAADVYGKLPALDRHRQWLLDNQPKLLASVGPLDTAGAGGRMLLSLLGPDMLKDVLAVVFDESRLLSDHGVRSLSKEHLAQPFTLDLNGEQHNLGYEPAESVVKIKGGNSNWRGPVWMPVNFLIAKALLRYQDYFAANFTIPLRKSSGQVSQLSLGDAAKEIARRTVALFIPDGQGARPIYAGNALFATGDFKDRLWFHEYFDGDNGKGLGAIHQTGWTALVANMIDELT